MTKLYKLSPILWPKDLAGTKSFYEDLLRFKGQGHFPIFVSLSRQNVEIMFIVQQKDPDDCKDPARSEASFPLPSLTGSLFILTENVDELWNLVKDKVTIKSSLVDREYLMRDFSLLDNNGYELVFGQNINNRIS